MPTQYDRDAYHSSAFDDHFCLRPPALLWIATLYLSRAILLPIAMGLGHYAGVNEDAMRLLRVFWGAETLIPSLIALPVLYTLCRRQPSASRAVRWIWERGRLFLAASALVDVVLNLHAVVPFTALDDNAVLSIFGVLVDLYFAAYVLAARRVRDTFRDFPPPLER